MTAGVSSHRVLLRAVLRRPAFIFAAAVFTLLIGLTALPLLRQPGYELATALGLALMLFGGLPAWACVSAARELDAPVQFSSLAGASLVLTLALPLPAVGIAVAASLLTTPCNPLAGLPLVLVIVPTAAFICAGVGLLAAVTAKRFRGFLGRYFLAVLAAAVVTVWPILAGPQVFAFNVFAGYFPGPIYDESLHLTSALLWARTEACLLACAAFAGAASQTGNDRKLRAVAALCLLAVLGIQLDSAQLGLRTTVADLDAALGGLRETAHFRIHHPRERGAREVEQLARDLEFRYAQDAAFLGVQAPQRIDVFYYRSAKEKQRWVGAAQTDFAKPWLHQFHLQLSGFPDPVAKHELAHVLAGGLGSKPFEVTAWAGLLPNPMIIEGLAVAADDRADELTLPEWAHALRALKLAPDLRRLLGPTGFFAAAPARAYTLSGAFLRYLVETYGREKLRVLYPHGDFVAAYGKSLDALVGEWEQANDAVPLDAHAMSVATRRFSQPSLFGRTCAREEALLREELEQVPAAEPARAIELAKRLRAIDPGDLGLLRDLAARLRDQGDRAGARSALTELLDSPVATSDQRAAARQALGSMDAEDGRLDVARLQFRELLLLQPDLATQRSAEVHLASFDTPVAVQPVLTYFAHPEREDALLNLRELSDAQPAFAPAKYLLGFRLTHADLSDHALAYLAPDSIEALRTLPATHDEALRLRARDHALLHACHAVADDASQLLHATPAAAAFFADWRARCEFEVGQGWKPLPPPD